MSTGRLHIDLSAIRANWQALDALSAPSVETAAVVKADGYGLGAVEVARALRQVGARRFFVATAEEGETLRDALGPEPEICIFSGHCDGDGEKIAWKRLTPMLNSPAQFQRHMASMADKPFGIQLDSGMNRLGMEPEEFASVRDKALAAGPTLIMSHLACADEPDHPMNATQLASFRAMTDGIGVPRSLGATGGVLLGPDYHFDVTRPGVGLYGGQPYEAAQPVVRLSLPVIQVRDVKAGESVGYGNSWIAERDSRIATLSAGYADGLIRAMSGKALLWHGAQSCPLVGRVSMDLLTIDVTDLGEDPVTLDILGPNQTVDQLADVAGTIGYEILTSLGARYAREWVGV